MTDIPHLLGLLVFWVGVPLNLLVVGLQANELHKRPDLRVLRERLLTAIAVLLFAVIFGLIFLNNDLDVPLILTEATRLITRLVANIVVFIPALYWLLLWWNGRRE